DVEICIDKKHIQLLFTKSTAKKIIHVSYEDTTITFSASEYVMDLNTALTCAKTTQFITVKNGTLYDWVDTKLDLISSSGKQHSVPLKPFDLRKNCWKKLQLKSEKISKLSPQHLVNISEFSNKKKDVHPELQINMVKYKEKEKEKIGYWPKDDVFFQDPGNIRLIYDNIPKWEKQFDATQFASIINEKKLPLFVNKNIKLTRSRPTGNLLILAMNVSNKSVIKNTLHTDYDFICDKDIKITLQVDSKTIFIFNKKQTISQQATLPQLDLLVDPNTKIDLISTHFKSLSSKLLKLKNDVESPLKIDESLKQGTKYTKFKGTTERDKLKSKIDKANQIAQPRLVWLYLNAANISSLLNGIPSEKSHQKNLYTLASVGNHDADVSLLRKQRIEQSKIAKSFIQVHNAFVSGEINIYPIQLQDPNPNQVTSRPPNPSTISVLSNNPLTVTPASKVKAETPK
ncbi:hypothetical protein, partial [uncultured Gimesia sp.]|uniref:hypothetical protein n=1 Tax=uncultured Gimesia sp. TaxID=1678688 RepID=UPI00261846B9